MEKVHAVSATITNDVIGLCANSVLCDSSEFLGTLRCALKALEERKVSIEEMVLTEKLGSDGFDAFMSFKADQLSVVSEVARGFDTHGDVEVVSDRLAMVRIEGSGFTRSHGFTDRVYSSISGAKINILAQTASDVELALYLEGDNFFELQNVFQNMDMKVFLERK